MSCEQTENRRYTWSPQDPKGMEHRTLARWLRHNMGEQAGNWWLNEIDRLINRSDILSVNSLHRLVQQICKNDCPELVELLCPRSPELFREAVDKDGRSALELCVIHNSVSTLWTLLELGVDPNGLDRERIPGHEFVDQDGLSTCFWLTPLDIALGLEHEDCAMLLRLYGGGTGAELSRTQPEDMPPGIPYLLPLLDPAYRLASGCVCLPRS